MSGVHIYKDTLSFTCHLTILPKFCNFKSKNLTNLTFSKTVSTTAMQQPICSQLELIW